MNFWIFILMIVLIGRLIMVESDYSEKMQLFHLNWIKQIEELNRIWMDGITKMTGEIASRIGGHHHESEDEDEMVQDIDNPLSFGIVCRGCGSDGEILVKQTTDGKTGFEIQCTQCDNFFERSVNLSQTNSLDGMMKC